MSSSTNKIPHFTDLGRALINDKKGELYKSLLETTEQKITTKEKALAAGLSRDEKNVAEAELSALKAANRIVTLFWHSMHHENKP